MLLDDFFTEVGTPSPSTIRPTRPTSANIVGRLETVAAVCSSDSSDMSDIKTAGAKPNCESKPLAPLPMDWTPDTWEGRACCYLRIIPERLRGVLHADLMGMGIPAGGLPSCLAGFSVNGWTLEAVDGELALKKAHPDARNEDGAKGYLHVHAGSVARAWPMWERVRQEVEGCAS